MQDLSKISKALQDTVNEVKPNMWRDAGYSVTDRLRFVRRDFAANGYGMMRARVGHCVPRGLECTTSRARA